MKITYFGHACFLVEVEGSKLLFDPFISPNELAKDIDISKIKADYILISHGHEDHVADAEFIAKNTNATLISNFEIVTWFQKKGVKNTHPMNIGGKWKFDFGTVISVNAVHSSEMPDGAYGGNPGGFVIQTNSGNFYYAGDTALHYDMKLIPALYPVDFAFLPLGDNFTMGINEAAKATDFIQCKNIIGMHYDTFGYIEIDAIEAKKKMEDVGANLQLIPINTTIDFKNN